MNVTDLPQPATIDMYRQAIARYAELVRPRSAAVYSLAPIEYPGLSFAKVLVVTGHCGADNRAYFSALQRLPRRFLQVFLHEPFILPAWSLRVMHYVAHRSATLLGGRHVIEGYLPAADRQERHCRILEAYCHFAAFRKRVSERKVLPARAAIEVTGSFRELLADAQDVFEGVSPTPYMLQIQRLRQTFFDRGEPADNVVAAWSLFETQFLRFQRVLSRWLGTSASEDSPRVARLLLSGEHERPGWDREYAFQRARDIAAYHHDLASLGIPYGHLFYEAAYPHLVRRIEHSLAGRFLQSLYRVRRRLEEFAGA
jgi:hypothetical protein